MAQGSTMRAVSAVAVGLALMACGKSNNDDNSATTTYVAVPTADSGLGPDTGPPVGTPVELPATISIVRAVGSDHTDASLQHPVCTEANAERVPFNEGSGVVDLCVTVRNESGSDETAITLPAGTVFSAVDSTDPAVAESQNGWLPQPATLSVPEGQTKTFILRLFCLNRAAPQSDRPAYSGDVTTNWEYQTRLVVNEHAPLLEVRALLADKLIEWSTAEVVQNAIWDVTEDSDGLRAENRANLAALPVRP